MKIAIRVVYFLALLLFAAGIFGLWQTQHPSSPAELLGLTAGSLATALTNPVVWLLLAGWAGGEVVARRSRRTPKSQGPARTAYRISPGSTAGAAGTKADDAGPARLAPTSGRLERQRGRGLLRIRLEAFLRGEPDVKAFIDELLAAAVQDGASDVHLQPDDDGGRVSWRCRGQLEELVRIPAAGQLAVVRRLKVMAELPPYVTDRPQDGQIRILVGKEPIAIRLATIPTAHGEKAALRLAGDARALPIESLFPDDELRQRFESLLGRPQGMIVLTGPTGSGKTTTLYSALDHLHRQKGNRIQLASIEDPIEVDLPFVHQTQVDRARELDFPQALRALLRQDPNVLMIGEIRDTETAKIAVQAALSGHLILTTLHADSGVGVFPRLIDLGVEPFLAASTTLASVSQRLVRRLCPECRRPREIDSGLRRQMERAAPSLELDGLGGRVWSADGCSQCEGRGFVDRMAVFELLEIDSELRRAVAALTPIPELDEMLSKKGHVTLPMAAMRLAASGEIEIQEALGLAP